MYDWRKMTSEERQRALELRRHRSFPWHSPPHWKAEVECQYLISAACYEHAMIIGTSSERMTDCEQEMLNTCSKLSSEVYGWCVLPNHHVLVRTENIKGLRHALGQFHGRTSFNWNGEDAARRRKVWHNCF